MTDTELKKPENFIEHKDTIMSNCDGSINEQIADEIKDKEMYSQYAGWNFCGYVWWQFGKWNCEVWVFHCHHETVSADSLQEIMEQVSNKYGRD